MAVALIIGLVFAGMFFALCLILARGGKFDVLNYVKAEKVIDSFKERAFQVCRMFSSEYSDPKGRNIWDGCIGREYEGAMGEMDFQIIRFVHTELDTIVATFNLGYETYDGEAVLQVRFPFVLLNLPDDELRSGYKVVQCGKKKTDKVFKIVEKEVENAD